MPELSIRYNKLQRFFLGRENEFSKEEDYVIICGDVGVCGFSAEEVETRKLDDVIEQENFTQLAKIVGNSITKLELLRE